MRATSLLFVVLFFIVSIFTVYGQEESKGPQIHGFLRPDWTIQKVDDPFRDNLRMYHFLTRTRIYLKGTYEGVRYRVELGLSGSEAEIPVSRVGFWGMPQILQDFYADVPFPGLEKLYVRVGQFKIPAGAEGLTYSADLPFVERSIVQKFVGLLRDYGVAFHAYPSDNFSLALALQTGLGRSIPNRYLPEVFGSPLVTARVQFGPNEGHDLFVLKPRMSDVTVRVGANLTYYKDVLAGHSTALNVWNKEKPILLNSIWNTFIGARPLEAGKLFIGGADAALGYPTAHGLIWLEGQLTYGQYKNNYGDVSVKAVRIQGTYNVQSFALGLRYALVQPENLGGNKVGNDAIQEISPMISYQMYKHVKIILDGSFLMSVPVAIEEGLGVYVLTDHPEEIALDIVERQDVVNIRAVIQINF